MKLINSQKIILLISLAFALIAWIVSKYLMLEYSKAVIAGWHTTVIEGVDFQRLFILLVCIVSGISNLTYALVINKKKYSYEINRNQHKVLP